MNRNNLVAGSALERRPEPAEHADWAKGGVVRTGPSGRALTATAAERLTAVAALLTAAGDELNRLRRAAEDADSYLPRAKRRGGSPESATAWAPFHAAARAWTALQADAAALRQAIETDPASWRNDAAFVAE